MKHDLLLYSARYCPFCRKVESFLADNSIAINTVYFDDDDSLRDTLSSLGGKAQVPCLIINGVPLYESDDIITWFKDEIIHG